MGVVYLVGVCTDWGVGLVNGEIDLTFAPRVRHPGAPSPGWFKGLGLVVGGL